MLKELEKLLPQFDVISFDIFDTLLLRPYLAPHDLWVDVESRENAKGFAKDRYAADRELYFFHNREGGEPTLGEVYGRIPQWSHMMERELECERSVLFANPEIVSVWNKAGELGKKRVIVSDMYLPGVFLKDVLTKNGIDGWDGFYVSSDYQLKKRAGELFRKMMDDFNISSDNVLHIGDNERADVEAANKVGVVAYGYQKVSDKFFDECPFAKVFLGEAPSAEKRFFLGAMAHGWHLYKCGHPDWTYWNKIGFLFAGTLGYLYMRMVGEDAKSRGIDHLMFVARDGYILQKIFNVLYPGVKTDYFYASRAQALFAAQCFGRTKIGTDLRRRYCLKVLEKENGVSLTPDEQDVYLLQGKLPQSAQQVFDSLSSEMKKESEGYLAKFEIDPMHTAIIDGNSTHLTMQRFVSSVVGSDVFAYYLFTNLPAENARSLCCADWDMRYLKFSEFLFGAPTAPLDRIKDGVPVFKQNVPFFERYKMDRCCEIEEGAIAAVRILDANCIGISHGLWLDWNDAFMDNLRPDDKEMLSLARNSVAIDHEEGYATILSSLPVPKYIRLFGRTILRFDAFRRSASLFCDIKLAGKIHLANVKKSTLSRVKKLLVSLK